jgi:hypothetical protein
VGRLRIKRAKQEPPPRLDAWDALGAGLVVLATLALYLPLAHRLPGFLGGRWGAYALLSLGVGGVYHARRKWWPGTLRPPGRPGLHRASVIVGLAGLCALLATIRLPRIHVPGTPLLTLAGEQGVMLVVTAAALLLILIGCVLDVPARRR